MMEEKKQKANNSQKENKNKPSSSQLTAIIRISGMVGVPEHIENALYRLRLRRKYVCVVIDANNKSIQGLLKKVKFCVAYGEISKETHEKLIKSRGKKVDGELKPFFRLHPPRKGIKSKLQYPKGVLGNNKNDINKLIERML